MHQKNALSQQKANLGLEKFLKYSHHKKISYDLYLMSYKAGASGKSISVSAI